MNKTTVTITRGYFKKITVTVNPELIELMNGAEQFTFLMEDYIIPNEESLFEKAELESMTIEEDNNEVDTDRFDIYDKNGKQFYGGHL